MNGFEIQVGVVGATLVLAIAVARAWTARTAHLNLTFFRPYRGDPWPIGVQEDDDFQWNWTATTAAKLAAPRPRTDVDGSGSLQEATSESIAVEHTGRISVRRGGP